MLQRILIWQKVPLVCKPPLYSKTPFIIRFTLCLCPCKTQSLTSVRSHNYINEYIICWSMGLYLPIFCHETQQDICKMYLTAISHGGRRWSKQWLCRLLLATSVSMPLSSSAETQSHLHLPLFCFLKTSLSASAIVFSLLSSLNHAILGFLLAPLGITHSLVAPTPFSPSPLLLHFLQTPSLNTSSSPKSFSSFLFVPLIACSYYVPR